MRSISKDALMTDKFHSIHEKVQKYYSQKVLKHGATPAGVDWKDSESQNLRFEQLVKVIDDSEQFSINDFGCDMGRCMNS